MYTSLYVPLIVHGKWMISFIRKFRFVVCDVAQLSD